MSTNWHVITGAPSSGKTVLITHLCFLGYRVLPEAARILLNDELSKGKTAAEIRHDEYAFQQKVLDLKIAAEARMPCASLTFFDRGLPDTLAYCRLYGFPEARMVEALQSAEKRYRNVFLLAPLQFVQDEARTEDSALSSQLSSILEQVYLDLNYNVVRVPILSVAERAEFVLRALGL